MDLMIAYCGLDCAKCEAYLATVNNDEELRRKVAKEWSELNGVEITPQMIHCEGCRTNGVKTVYCSSLCPIRKCASKKNCETCGACAEMETCESLAPILSFSEEARQNLHSGR